MKIIEKFQDFIIFSEDSIQNTLLKLNSNKSRIIFVVTEKTKLIGSVSDGDIRRWLISNPEIDLQKPVFELANTACVTASTNESNSEIASMFSEAVFCIPILDNYSHIARLAFSNVDCVVIDGRSISKDSPAYVIAEIGNNHQGNLEEAKKLVDAAVNTGADCVKFQMRNMEKLYKNKGVSDDVSADLGAQYTMDLLERFQLTNDELFEVFDYSKSRGITPLCTPWDLGSLSKLEDYGMPAYKVASADFTNFELLAAIADTGKPMFCSTGMSSELEIKNAVDFLNGISAVFVLLHCNSTYPTPYKDVNLKYITRLEDITGRLIGYSGHERGFFIPVACVALGAVVIEKHLTFDKSQEGTDHKVSLLPEEFKEMVTQIRFLEKGLGSDKRPREITQGEQLNRESLAKSLVANRDIVTGELITREMIEIKSPGQGIQPNKINDLIGKKAKRIITSGDYFYDSDINGLISKKSEYKFDRLVGVPVRYHDYNSIIKDVNLDFVEFHLSYKDMEVDFKNHINGEQSIGYAVHSPELFSHDHILDLASDDEDYLEISKKELSKVIEITRELNRYFPKTNNPVVVVNAGGWNQEGFYKDAEIHDKYKLVSKALKEIDDADVQIAIQTMPPFPWHFGGQSFHNLFVCADQIVEFCETNKNIKICLDISHSMMACNYYGWDFLEFVDKVLPYTVHLHVVDAKCVDGEGVDIGEGDVDFNSLSNLLNDKAKGVQFIPEVWQGHKNGGEGFWKALDYLEKYL